jgi:hypothetical protein
MTVVQKRMKSKEYEALDRRDPEFEAILLKLLRAGDPIMKTKSQTIAKTLAARLENPKVTDEKVRAAIRALVVHGRVPIHSRSAGGFELIKDLVELGEEEESLRRRAAAMLTRADRLASLRNLYRPQMELFLEPD